MCSLGSMKNIVFDLDGTLADTSGDLIGAANSCFIDLGHGALLDPNLDKLTAFHGGRAMLKKGFEKIKFIWMSAKIIKEKMFNYKKIPGWYPQNSSIKDLIKYIANR